MIDYLYSWIKDIIFYIILVTVILNLSSRGSYRKYVKLVTGMLLILLVLRPVLGIAGKSDFFNNSFDNRMFEVEAEEAKQGIFAMEGEREDTIFKEYEQIVRIQTEKMLKKKALFLTDFSITLNKDKESLEYGSLDGMDIKASYFKTEEGVSEEIKEVTIEKINIEFDNQKWIDGTENKEQNNTDTQNRLSPIEISIKNMIADFYNIDEANINISIREEHNGEK